jgi:hypothetical protein
MSLRRISEGLIMYLYSEVLFFILVMRHEHVLGNATVCVDMNDKHAVASNTNAMIDT